MQLFEQENCWDKDVRIYLIEGSIKLNLENENNPLSVIFNSGMTDNVRNESGQKWIE